MDLYLSEDGQSGIAVKPNGDIVSVFAGDNAPRGSGYTLMLLAIQNGGRQLDCFDTHLPDYYSLIGFKPVAKMKWNDEYIPEGWNKDNFKDYNNGEPDVVFMAYDPNNDIEKKKKEAEEKYGKKNEIPYIIDYDDGEDYQHMYKWRSPAEREAIYNNMLERYKNAKTTEELKKVFSNSDKPFLRQMDDLNSLSKEQAQSINAEYSKRYLELIKDENPEEYKKNKKYLERKYNIKSDASIYIDSLIDTIEYIDAEKKEFKEEDVNRDEDGKFAKKGSSSNKSNDNDKRTIKERIKSLPKHLQETGNKLYNNNPIPSDLIIKDDANYDTEDILAYIDEDNIDEEKYSKLNEIETLLNRFTENAQGTRESKTFKKLKKDIEELIENAPPVKNPHRVEYMIEGRDDLSIGTVINFDIRSFADFGAGDKTANKIYNYLRDEVDPSKLVVYVIDDEVNALDMTTISSYPNQNECLINGDFIISEVEEGDEYNPPIVHLKKPKK